MENDGDINNPFTYITIWHKMSITNKDTIVGIYARLSGMLKGKWWYQHLCIAMTNIINESYLLILHLNYEHMVNNSERRETVTWQLDCDLLFNLLWNQIQFELPFRGKVKYDVNFICNFDQFGWEFFSLLILEYLTINIARF